MIIINASDIYSNRNIKYSDDLLNVIKKINNKKFKKKFKTEFPVIETTTEIPKSKTYSWKKSIELKENNNQNDVESYINMNLNKLSNGNVEKIFQLLCKTKFTDKNQFLLLFTLTFNKLLIDPSYVECYIRLIIMIHKTIDLQYDIIKLLIDKCEEIYKTKNISNLLFVLYKNDLLNQNFIDDYIKYLFEENKIDQLHDFILLLKSVNKHLKYKNLKLPKNTENKYKLLFEVLFD